MMSIQLCLWLCVLALPAILVAAVTQQSGRPISVGASSHIGSYFRHSGPKHEYKHGQRHQYDATWIDDVTGGWTHLRYDVHTVSSSNQLQMLIISWKFRLLLILHYG